VILAIGCKPKLRTNEGFKNDDFTIAFGSCNKTEIDNLLWDDILDTGPDLWIWGGDNIYADTDDMEKLRKMYEAQKEVLGYKKLSTTIPIIGTWDDHDYGLNDGGVEYVAKEGSQQLFLDFMGIHKDNPRRSQKGVYATHLFNLEKGSIKVFVLDTRYFRTQLTPDTETEKRVKPNVYGEGTLLGEAQWSWLGDELKKSDSNFNVIVSSIQFLSNEHGFECWGNFPHEVDRLKSIISGSGAKGVILLSGDRHISEFSRATVEGLDYALIDFTSSGLTHAYSKFDGEPNPYRVGEVVNTESFGTVAFDFKTNTVTFTMRGNDNEIRGILEQRY
jgi:alkaline phosphatase D